MGTVSALRGEIEQPDFVQQKILGEDFDLFSRPSVISFCVHTLEFRLHGESYFTRVTWESGFQHLRPYTSRQVGALRTERGLNE